MGVDGIGIIYFLPHCLSSEGPGSFGRSLWDFEIPRRSVIKSNTVAVVQGRVCLGEWVVG